MCVCIVCVCNWQLYVSLGEYLFEMPGGGRYSGLNFFIANCLNRIKHSRVPFRSSTNWSDMTKEKHNVTLYCHKTNRATTPTTTKKKKKCRLTVVLIMPNMNGDERFCFTLVPTKRFKLYIHHFRMRSDIYRNDNCCTIHSVFQCWPFPPIACVLALRAACMCWFVYLFSNAER